MALHSHHSFQTQALVLSPLGASLDTYLKGFLRDTYKCTRISEHVWHMNMSVSACIFAYVEYFFPSDAPLTQPTAQFSVLQTWCWQASSGLAHCYSTPAPLHPRLRPSTAASELSLKMQPATTYFSGAQCSQTCLKLSLAGRGMGHSP